MRVLAQGGGYNGTYRAVKAAEGWCFVTKDATFLTPGIGKPMHYDTPEALLEAVSQRKSVRVTVLPEEE